MSALAAAPACGHPGNEVSSAPTTSTARDRPADTGPNDLGTVHCEAVIDSVDEPPASYTSYLDVVSLPTKRRLQSDQRGDASFAKAGLLVRAGASATLRTVPGSPLRIAWGDVQEPALSLALPSCDNSRKWVVFAGGFWVREHACVEIVVRDATGREATARIGVGADCPP